MTDLPPTEKPDPSTTEPPLQVEPRPPAQYEPVAAARTAPDRRRRAVSVIVSVVGVIIFLVSRGHSAAPVGTTAHPTTIAATGPTPTDPFDQTAAADFGQGAGGIVLPEPFPVGPFSQDQVAAILARVKAALVAARLDPRMLEQHDDSAFLGLLAPDNRAKIQTAFDTLKFGDFATELAAGQQLTGDAVRVSGHVRLSQSKEKNGVRDLDIKTDFVWVYPFAGALSRAGDHIVVVHDTVDWSFAVEGDVIQSSNGLFLEDHASYTYNADCGLAQRGLLSLLPTPEIPYVSLDEALKPGMLVTGFSVC
jgi:hypothetical protein